MKEERTYQHDFSESFPSMRDSVGRTRKAETMVAVLDDYFDYPLTKLRILDIGGSTGIIDNYLAEHFGSVTGVDIDEKAVAFANENFRKTNLFFHHGDAMSMDVADEMYDVVICSQIYEHVPDSKSMIREIYRVLRPGGICYFAATSRLRWREPHYKLPLLSVVPRFMAHWYIRMSGKADFYHELHFSYWGLKKLVKKFKIIDYTRKTIAEPDQFRTAYMLPPGSIKYHLARLIVTVAYWAMPGYIWLLRKPGEFAVQKSVTNDVWSTAKRILT